MLTATPAQVAVHYNGPDGRPHGRHVGWVHQHQPAGRIALVTRRAAWQDPNVCCWMVALDRITRVEVLVAGHTPTVMEQLLAGLALSPWEQLVYDTLRQVGGPVQYRDVVDIVTLDASHDHLEPRQVLAALASLRKKGRVTLTPSAGLASGVVTITGTYQEVSA